VDRHQTLRSVGELPHEPARFVVTDRQVGQLEAAPASLALSERQVARAAHDLPHAGMAEQMRVHRRRLAGRTMPGGTQRQDANVSSLGGLLYDEPGLAALKWPAGAGGAAFAGEEERGSSSATPCSLAHSKSSPVSPSSAPGRNTRLEVRLGFLRLGSTRLSRCTSLGRRASTSEMRAPVAHSTRRSSRSRSVAAAAMMARTSSGESPSGGCQCLVPDRTERAFVRESDSTREPRTAIARVGILEFRPDICGHRTQGALCLIR
jgi:hypothetical protein